MEQRQFAMQEQRDRIKHHAERKIWVTFRKEGIHKYPAAATDPALATGDEYDVSFLGVPHRHIFHFRVWIDVWHNDRDIDRKSTRLNSSHVKRSRMPSSA
mgnify:CR=1 FL=1